MPISPNPYTQVLRITTPIDLRAAKDAPDAGPFSLFLAVLMAEGGPLTLDQAADRLAEAGVGARDAVLRSLSRSRPGRSPVYRHGDRYYLDPYDHDADLWAFRLGLRPARGSGEVIDPSLSPEDAAVERDRQWRARREQEALGFARLRRAILRGWPLDAPQVLVVLDVDTEHVTRYAAEAQTDRLVAADVLAISEVAPALDAYDVLAGVEIRPLLEGLGVPFAGRRLHELRPPQATLTPAPGRKPVDVTLPRLLKGSCGIARPWKTDRALEALARRRDGSASLQDAVDAEVRDLAALYRYGRLHGAVRLRIGRVDELLLVPWTVWGEWRLGSWMDRAAKAGQPLEGVTTGDDADDDPWARSQWFVVHDEPGYRTALITSAHQVVQPEDLQRVRFACPGAWHAPLPVEAVGPPTAPTKPPAPDPRILRVRVELDLEGEAPNVWRVIELPADATFWTLHVAIQDAMGWLDYHLHVFERPAGPSEPPFRIGLPIGESWDDEPEPLAGWTEPVLRHLSLDHPTCDYEYDFGDSWRHRIRLEAIAPRDPARTYPRCVDGARACPPEDVGSAPGFAEFLEAIANPRHVDHRGMLEWVGGAYDPAAFDPAAVAFDEPCTRWARAFRLG